MPKRHVDGTAGDQLFLQHPRQIPAGPYRIFMMPLAWEYYEHDLRITREIRPVEPGQKPIFRRAIWHL